MKIILLRVITVLISLCAASPALSVGYIWDTQKGPTGSWADANHWSPPDSYPNGTDDGASIDNDPSVASNVTYALYSYINSVNWISLAANQVSLTNPNGDPDRLNLYGSLRLVPSTTDDPPQLSNDGILYLDGALQFQEASNEGDYGQKLIEKALSPTEQLILDMLSTIRVIGIDPAAIVSKPDPLKVFVNRLQEMLVHVAKFNDPKGVYANCFCEID